MTKLIKKEFSLSMHPIVPLMVLLSAMVLIPNYPYLVMYFYVSMAVFFTCLLGRENNDIVYSVNLPVRKDNIVKARILFSVIIEIVQMILMIPFALVRANMDLPGNQAGMDANLTLFAYGFIVYGIFNLVFFGSYYKNVNKVGIAFVKTSVIIFICVAIDVATSIVVPFIRDYLDTPDLEFMGYKVAALAVGILIYIILTLGVCKISVKNFDKQDLN